MSPRGLAPASRCPLIPEHRRSRDPTQLLQLRSHPGMGPHGMAAAQRAMNLGVLAEPWGASPPVHSQAGCPRCLHRACPSEELPGSRPGLFTRSRLCPPRMAQSWEQRSRRQPWGQGSAGSASGAGVPPQAGQDPLSVCSSGARAGWDKPRNARAAASDTRGRTQSPATGGSAGTGLSRTGQGHLESCPPLGTHTPGQWGQAGLGYPGLAGCRGCAAL